MDLGPLAAAIAGRTPDTGTQTPNLRLGVSQGTNPADRAGTIRVLLDGTVVPGVTTLCGPVPTGTPVWMLETGGMLLVMGIDGGLLPIGSITAYGGTTAPTGWHLCDGTAHGSTALQTILGSANSPDLRDRFIVGAGSGYSRGDTGGAAAVTLALSQIPVHSHGGATATDSPDHTHPTSGFTVPAGSTLVGSGGTSAFYGNSNSSGTGGASARHTHSIAADGGGGSHENRPPYYALVYIIRKG